MSEAVFQKQDLKVFTAGFAGFFGIGSVISFGLDISKLICDSIF
jgi:hypothetical protein